MNHSDLPAGIATCAGCGQPAHASETDDNDLHRACARAAEPYSVTLWGSNPDLPENVDNDDCWTGEDFATREAALAAYRGVVMFPDDSQLARACGPRGAWECVMIDGPDTHEVTQNPDRPSCERHQRDLASGDYDWRHERAMQAGMAFGCDGYNDEMGW